MPEIRPITDLRKYKRNLRTMPQAAKTNFYYQKQLW